VGLFRQKLCCDLLQQRSLNILCLEIHSNSQKRRQYFGATWRSKGTSLLLQKWWETMFLGLDNITAHNSSTAFSYYPQLKSSSTMSPCHIHISARTKHLFLRLKFVCPDNQ